MSNFTFFHGKNRETSFSINKCGATVSSWKVNGTEHLFLSTKAILDGSKAIRGGIPLCFPQFGPWGEGRAQHGFARTSNDWEMKDKCVLENGDTSVTMVLVENESTLKLWNHKFVFSYTITLTEDTLKLEANIENKGDTVFDHTFCFHTYFRVEDIKDAKVKGLKGLTYIDKTKQDKPRVVEENSELSMTEFTDRVYENAPDRVELSLGGTENKVVALAKRNLRDMVVWNPWSENCQKMSDMDDDGYLRMICVEAAHTSERAVVKPATTWSATHTMTVVNARIPNSMM